MTILTGKFTFLYYRPKTDKITTLATKLIIAFYSLWRKFYCDKIEVRYRFEILLFHELSYNVTGSKKILW